MNLESLIAKHIAFSKRTFLDETALTSFRKLEKEMEELEEILDAEPDIALKEYVDCFMCLCSSMGRKGILVQDFVQAFEDKLQVNLARKWIRNEDGTYSHVKQ